ncbi:MAG: DUF4337 domain-containing protein [Magnetococcales bacterium]|nr:DUF4337 domain-containing protein [Magnetococcales bacterium]
MMKQSQASDQWAYFQAKSIKGYLYEIQKDQIELQMKTHATGLTPEDVKIYQQKADAYAEKIAGYQGEKGAIQTEAKKLEELRDNAQQHGKAFGVAIIFLQVAILLSSIAALLKIKPVWFVGLAVGVFGLLHFANGFLLFL